MGCGCVSRQGPRQAGLIAQRAAMCHFCSRAEHHAASALALGAVACTALGKPISEVVFKGDCPGGRFPDADGRVRWFVRWNGIPWPMRLVLWAVHAQHPKIGWWPGCGCITALKAILSRK